MEHHTLDDIREYLRLRGYVHVASHIIDHIFVNKEVTTIYSKDPAPASNIDYAPTTPKYIEKIEYGTPPSHPKYDQSPPKIRTKNKNSIYL